MNGFANRHYFLRIIIGSWAPASTSYSEIIITGHQDGSVKFWDAGSGSLLVLYKLKTAKIFEKPKSRSLDGSSDEDPLAIQAISLCAESRQASFASSNFTQLIN